MFEKSSRLKLRFETDRGNVSVEDLWDMPLTSRATTSLDDVAKQLHRSLKENEEESFVIEKSGANEMLEMKFSVVKHVIKVRLAEQAASENAAEGGNSVSGGSTDSRPARDVPS